jgi:WD40 repeat protein
MQRFMSGALVSAYRYSPAEHVRRLVSRHKVLFSSAAVFAVMLAAVSVVYMWNLAQKNIQLAASREEEHAQRLVAEAAHVAANDARWLAEQKTYVSQIRLISEYANGHNYDAARRLIWETSPTLRNWEWGHLLNRCYQAQLTLARCALVRLSPDGKQLATLSLSEPPRVWSAADGDLLATLDTEPVRYLSLVYSPTGDMLLAGATDGSVRSWNPHTGKSLRIYRGHRGYVTDAAFLPDGQFIVSVSSDGTLNRWNVTTGEPVASARTDGESLNSVLVAENGIRILTGLEHDVYAVWDADSLDRMWTFDGVTPSFDPKGEAILVARESGALLLDSATGDPRQVTFHHGATVLRTQFNAQENLVLTLGTDGEIKIWNATNASPVTQITPPDETIDAVFSPSGTRLLSHNSKGGGQLWDVTSGKLLATFDGHSAPVTMSLFSGDERTFVTASRDHTVNVWSIAGPIGRRVLFDSGEALEKLSVAPGSGRAALASESGRCVVLDVQRGASVADFGAFGMQFSPSISLNSTGDRAAIVVDDFTPMVYDIAENRVVTSYYGHHGIVRSVSMSPDGRFVVSCGADGTAQIWDAENGETSAVLTGHKDIVHSAVFDAQGDRILSASGDGTARLWDRNTGAELTIYRGHTNDVVFAQFSPDGRRVISVSTDRTTRIWDAESGQELLVLEGNNRGFSCALFSPDGSRAFTGGVDGDVKVWDTESGELLDSCGGHRGLVQTLQIGLADNQLFSASADGLALMWEAAPLFGQDKRDRAGAQMLDDLAQYKTRSERSLRPPLFHEDAEDFHVLLSADAWRDNLTRLAVFLRSGDPVNRTDDSGEGFSIPGGPIGNAFNLLGLAPGDRISGVSGTGIDQTTALTAAIADVAAESPTGVTLHIERDPSRRLHLIPMEVHRETVAVSVDWTAGTALLVSLRDKLVAGRTMLDDVRRQKALERGEIQVPSEPILGVWLIAKPDSDAPADSPDLGLAAWDRIVGIDGQEIYSVDDLVSQIDQAINSDSTDRPRSLAMEVVRGEFRRISIQLNFNL